MLVDGGLSHRLQEAGKCFTRRGRRRLSDLDCLLVVVVASRSVQGCHLHYWAPFDRDRRLVGRRCVVVRPELGRQSWLLLR